VIPSNNGYQAADWLKTVMKSTAKITTAIPSDLSPQEIVARVRDTSELAVKVGVSLDKTHAVLGRLLMLARQKPQSYEALGYSRFTDYLIDEVAVKYGVGRTTAMNCKRIAEKYGALPLSSYAEISEQKLLLLARFSSDADSSAPKLLKAASDKTLEQLRTWIDEKGFLPKDESVGGVLTFTGPLSKIREAKRFLARADIRAYAGDSDLDILLAAFAEVDSEWTEQAARAIK
jgi:hypothetical protein